MSPGGDADPALAPPVARAEAIGGGAYGWIAEPTVELIDLLDAERAYYTRASPRSPSCVRAWRRR